MKHPAYHLRPNKAVDRLTLVESLKYVAKFSDLSEYTYYGFGGPYLEDFRLLYEFYPEIRMVSVESDDDTYKRQRFHIPCRATQLELRKTEFSSFLARYEAKDEKSIFWLDYTGLEYAAFEEFMVLLQKVAAGSIVKVSLRCEPSDYFDPKKSVEFRRKFGGVLPSLSTDAPSQFGDFASLVQTMMRIAAQRTLSSAMTNVFVPVCSFYYADGAGMFTLAGVVCLRSEQSDVRKAFKNWRLANLNWRRPRRIDVPQLSTKERLHLQRQLPCGADAGKVLLRALGYLIDEDRPRSEAKLKQYADFHRYFPYFVKAVP